MTDLFRTGSAGTRPGTSNAGGAPELGQPGFRRTFTVSPTEPGAFRTIAAALQEAEAGAVISVLPGTYTESLVITRPCRITAEGGRGSVTISASAGSAISMATSEVNLHGLTLRNSDTQRAALDVGVGTLTAEQCDIMAAGAAGVFVRDSATLNLSDSRVENPGGLGILITAAAGGLIERTTITNLGGTALLLRGGANPIVRDCAISDANGNGICASDGARGTIQNCDVFAIGSPALAFDTGAQTRVLRTTIRDTPSLGIFATTAAEPTIEDCVIENAGSVSVMAEDRATPHLVRCVIRNSAHGSVYIANGGKGEFTDCTIENSGGDGAVVAGESEILFTGGSITGSTGVGLRVTERSAGRFVRLGVHGSLGHGIELTDHANPLLREVSVTGSGGAGISVRDSATGSFEDCRVSDSAVAGLRVEAGGQPTMLRSTIRGGGAGVIVSAKANAVLRDCEIVDSEHSGLLVETDGEVSVTGSRIRGAVGCGIEFENDATGRVTGCEVYANGGHGISVLTRLPVAIKQSSVHDNGGAGLSLIGEAEGLTVAELVSTGNELSDDWSRHDSSRARIEAPPQPGDGPDGEVGPQEEGNDTGLLNVSNPDPVGEDEHAAHNAEASSLASSAASLTAAGGNGNQATGLQSLLAELNSLVGLAGVKHEVSVLVNLHQLAKMRADAGLPLPPMSRHLVFTGAPGTGKTTIARLYAQILRELGTLRGGHVVEVSRADLVASIVGGTALKATEKFNAALGGVLFIDEAYTLSAESGSGADFGQEAIDTIVKLMEDHRDDIVVIAAGYSHEMRSFLSSNPGLASRFTRTIEFENYSDEELVTIVEEFCRRHHYMLEYGSRQSLSRYFEGVPRDANFGNGRTARKLFEDTIGRQAQRLAAAANVKPSELTKLLPEDIGPPPGGALQTEARADHQSTLDQLLATLESMVGLASVKHEVTNMVNLLGTARRRMEAGLPVPSLSRNLIFSGAPGTGKTTVARLYGQLLSALGVLGTGQLIEVSRGDLVAEYVGQTAGRTKEAFNRARGGVLFIDEAYTLTPNNGGGNDFAREAIDTLIKLMEDSRDDVVVIAAGYADEMQEFLDAFPGLASRFSQNVEFENYEPEELLTIVEHHASVAGYELSLDCRSAVLDYFGAIPRGKTFGNGRFARQVLDSMITRQAGRLSRNAAPTRDDLRTLVPDDLAARTL
jgi:SpoVK/Ycf46/Vps4 family AAA+-type ATPase/nitrous oxidase accessory protein NosD